MWTQAPTWGGIQRQHRFLISVTHRLATGGIPADPGRAIGLARTVLGATKVDQGFTPQELVSLSSDLSRLPAAQTEFTVVPVAGFNPVIEGVGTTLEWDEAAAEKTFATLDQDRTLTPRYVFRGPARGPLASGPGMAVPPCRGHDLGGGATGPERRRWRR
ncbi:hypothetical protein OG698_22940 [Streptomyces sp. NBC_01003]|uniref:hypothetical protein n=1 Tax=Streptomyces sp. NBC_01003 TaxID=2903714 RepID=UPI0038706F73|nr:hypothetical protein OG698_22940 [Streptomyces sp. NBC_01003]